MVSPLAAALSMQQPIMPASKANIAPTDVLGAYQMATNQANQQYLAKLQQQNSLWGGLAGLGGSALTASILKGNLFGPAASTATNAATAATPLASGAALPDLGNLAFDSAGAPVGIYGVGPLASAAPTAASAAPAVASAVDPTAALFDAGGGLGAGALADATGAGAADAAGTIAGDIAAADAAGAVGAGAADAAAGGMTLADLLPFLFAV